MYYFNGRFYDANVGRFINAGIVLGSAGNSLGNNVYAYSFNNPITFIDPNGCLSWSEFKDIAKLIWNYKIDTKIKKINETEEFTSKYLDGTLSAGIFGTVSWLLTGTVNPMGSVDSYGNATLQLTLSGGVSGLPGHFSLPSAMVGYNMMTTSANRVSQLNGWGGAFGGSIGVMSPPLLGASLGGECVSNFDYWGVNIFGGFGIFNQPELHG